MGLGWILVVAWIILRLVTFVDKEVIGNRFWLVRLLGPGGVGFGEKYLGILDWVYRFCVVFLSFGGEGFL